MKRQMSMMTAVLLLGILSGCGSKAESNVPVPTTPSVPAAVPVKKALSSTDVATAFKEAGLEAENARAMTPQDYGMAPAGLPKEGTRFFIPSLDETASGRVMTFANKEDFEKMKSFYVDMGKQSGMAFTWVVSKGTVLVILNSDLKPEQVKQYEAVLDKVIK